MTQIETLRRLNEIAVYSVFDKAFKTFGRVVDGYDFSAMTDWLRQNTPIPENGNVYVPSVPELEATQVFSAVEAQFYGGMPAQTGYCNGRNTTLNGFEYHKGSEINIGCDDMVLLLCHTWEIAPDNTIDGKAATAFYLPAGTPAELYEPTLHLSPCRLCDEGFRTVVILPRGTNTPLDSKPDATETRGGLLLMKNKWVIAHPEREPLIRQGAFPGVKGENYEFRYKEA